MPDMTMADLNTFPSFCLAHIESFNAIPCEYEGPSGTVYNAAECWAAAERLGLTLKLKMSPDEVFEELIDGLGTRINLNAPCFPTGPRIWSTTSGTPTVESSQKRVSRIWTRLSVRSNRLFVLSVIDFRSSVMRIYPVAISSGYTEVDVESCWAA